MTHYVTSLVSTYKIKHIIMSQNASVRDYYVKARLKSEFLRAGRRM